MANVKITPDANGNIVCGGTVSQKDGKTYGFIRVESVESVAENGWLRTQKRSALIRGVKADLEAWVANNSLRVGSALPGRIRVVENTVAAYDGQQPKRKGADGPVLYHEGSPIYRHTEYCAPTHPDFAKADVLLQHEVEVTASTPMIK